MTDFNSQALTAAEGCIATAKGLGYGITAELADAVNVVAEFKRVIALRSAPVPPVPTDPAKVLKFLEDQAKVAAEHSALVVVAEQHAGQAVGRLISGYRGALDAWTDALAVDFAKTLAEFMQALPLAPLTINASCNDEQVAAHVVLLRNVEFLDFYQRVRVDFGMSIGEVAAAPGGLWPVAAMPVPPSDPVEFNRYWPIVNTYIRDYGRPGEDAVTRWRGLIESGLEPSIAPAGQCEARFNLHSRWQGLANTLNTEYGGRMAFDREVTYMTAGRR